MPALTGIPARIALVQDKGPARVAAIAEGLALAEMLEDADISWDLPDSAKLEEGIKSSLRRLIETRGTGSLDWFMLALQFTDNLDELDEPNMPSAADVETARAERAQGVTFGGFRLAVSAVRAAIVGRSVQALEKAADGAGYALLGLLESALDATVGVASPYWAHDIISMSGENYYDEEDGLDDDLDNGRVTLERFYKYVPGRACHASWQPAAADRGLALAGKGKRGAAIRAGFALADACDALGELPRSAWGYANDRNEFEADIVRASVLRWSHKDHISQIFDDYNDQMESLAEGYTEAPYLAAFRLDPADPTGSAESVKNAALRLSGTLGVIAAAEALISLLHTEPPKPREKRQGKPLTEVLIGDYNRAHPGQERETDGRLLTAL